MSLAKGPQDGLWWRLRDLGWLIPEQSFEGTKQQPPVLGGAFRGDGARLFTRMCGWRVRDSRLELKQEFCVSVRKNHHEDKWGNIHRGCAALGNFRVLMGNVLSNLLWSHSCSCSQEEVGLEVLQASSNLFSNDPLYLACVVKGGCLTEAGFTCLKEWQKYSNCMIRVSKRFLSCTKTH